jgi:hypothetical protein
MATYEVIGELEEVLPNNIIVQNTPSILKTTYNSHLNHDDNKKWILFAFVLLSLLLIIRLVIKYENKNSSSK